ncbi:cysteine desulfurase family protein [Pelagicoccus sp. SDUM812003]|uniref:cysteine desulfurase family protein n=1 Tax=Pelagicoccus sp. SDUM812003 TaxID=3041267 RepID=UPI00280FEC37|nr:cysteine desulfurase family protein [Pelagicoccus sp. SDUM812003]MDQ8203346.1 cysteine desulfurase family protein [Pelagicoccus sp. SDUM812003]
MIYLDHNATSPIEKEVLDAMLPWLGRTYGNPSSGHQLGRSARKAIEEAKDAIAGVLDCSAGSIVFTSGATESINTAICSAFFSGRDHGCNHILTTSVEHSATISTCRFLENMHGAEVTYLPASRTGELDLAEVQRHIRASTCVVSVIWGNNETGVVLPARDIAAICREVGVLLHLDAVQIVGKSPISFDDLGADFLSFSGHKFGAPKGIGGLLIRNSGDFVPLLHGGKQQNGLRAGTENVASIVGLAKALAIRSTDKAQAEILRIKKLRDEFESRLAVRIPDVDVNGQGAIRLPNTSNVYIPGLDSDALVTYLDQRGICVSSGSACLEEAITPSHVVLSMTGSHERASESVRISFGLDNTSEEIEKLINEIVLFRELF